LIKIFWIIGVVILILFAGFKRSEGEWYIDLLPQELGVETSYIEDGESGLREGCGIVIFYLTQETIKKINTEKLGYFRNARISRKHDRRYGEWKMTPLSPKSENAVEEIGTGLNCAKSIDKNLEKEISRAMYEEGGYYTFGTESTILILPVVGIVVFGYFG
jgi:hypothetical protein